MNVNRTRQLWHERKFLKKVHAILSRHITYFVLDIHVLDLYLPNMHGKQVDGELASNKLARRCTHIREVPDEIKKNLTQSSSYDVMWVYHQYYTT